MTRWLGTGEGARTARLEVDAPPDVEILRGELLEAEAARDLAPLRAAQP